MITPSELKSLNAEEQKQADAAEKFIDKTIADQDAADPTAKKYVVKTDEVAKASGGLSIKVRSHVVDQYSDQDWRISFDEKTRVLTFAVPRKRKTKATVAA